MDVIILFEIAVVVGGDKCLYCENAFVFDHFEIVLFIESDSEIARGGS